MTHHGVVPVYTVHFYNENLAGNLYDKHCILDNVIMGQILPLLFLTFRKTSAVLLPRFRKLSNVNAPTHPIRSILYMCNGGSDLTLINYH